MLQNTEEALWMERSVERVNGKNAEYGLVTEKILRVDTAPGLGVVAF